MMYFCYIFLCVSILNFLHDVHASSCVKNCTDKPAFTPSRLVVRFGDSASASCSVCQHACNNNLFGLEKSVGVVKENGTTLSWRVDSLTEWGTAVMCYYNDEVLDLQCCSILPVTVYKPPDNVSVSFVNHTGTMWEGREYTLQCSVQGVAPVPNLVVTFYRGQTAVGQALKSDNKSRKPASEIFSLNFNASKGDDGAQYWCEAKLDFGHETPELPLVVKSDNITTAVYYKPQLQVPSHPDPVTITEGRPLQLSCSAAGNPSPSYAWTLPSDGLRPPNGSIFITDSTTSVHKGPYTCSASNSMGTVTVKFSVDVEVNYTLYIIVGVLAAAVIIIAVIAFIFVKYYKQNRMGQYILKGVDRLHMRRTPVPTSE